MKKYTSINRGVFYENQSEFVIKKYAFLNFRLCQEIVIGDYVSAIESEAFSAFIGNIYVSNSVLSLGSSVFSYGNGTVYFEVEREQSTWDTEWNKNFIGKNGTAIYGVEYTE